MEEVYLNMPNLHFIPGGMPAIGLQVSARDALGNPRLPGN